MFYVFALLHRVLSFLEAIIFIRVILSWLPSIDWYRQPFKLLDDMTEPFLSIFRNLIPPIGPGIDISPMLLFFALQLLNNIIPG